MANTQLHPIVIQAIISGHFECLGEGLLHDGVRREEPSVLKDLIAPTKTSKRIPIEDRERPKKWWKAQCLHYGLQVPSTAPISTYRVHLENAIRQRGGLKRPQDLTNMELEQDVKFRRLNAEVREATSGSTQAKPPKGKAKTTQASAVTLESTTAVKTKPEPKAKAEPKSKAEPKPKTVLKTKAEKAKAEPKVKPGAGTSASATTSTSKTTTTKKRKAETIIHHVYHYDGDRADQIAAPCTTDQETTKRPTKKARTVAPPAPAPAPPHASSPDLPPSYSQTFPSAAPSTHRTKQTARRHRFWRLNGQYEINCTSEENWPSPHGCKPSITVHFGADDEPGFEGFLELPGFMICKLRLKAGAPRPEDGYLRFEWCGREEGTGEILTPTPFMVGWLKVHHDYEQEQSYIKGMITGRYGEFTFNGSKLATDSSQNYEWEDFEEEDYVEANHRRWR